MTTRSIYQQDSYNSTRYFQRHAFFDDALNPMDLRGCKIMTTWKPVVTSLSVDPNDSVAPIKHEIQISLGGTVTVSTGLVLETVATDGVILEHLTTTETANMPLDTELIGDLQLIDANGEILTWLFSDRIKAVSAVTNRAPS